MTETISDEVVQQQYSLGRLRLRWSPFPNDAAVPSDLLRCVSFYSNFVTSCLAEFISWYCHIQSATVLNEFESVNLIGPLDDGGGELEMTPISTALIASLIVLHSKCLKHLSHTKRVREDRKIIKPFLLRD